LSHSISVSTGRAALAGAVFAAAALLAGCASARSLDAGDFPTAASAEGGTAVAWKGTLLDIRYAAPDDRPSVVHVGGFGRWTVVFRVTESRPQIPPFASGRNVTLGIDKPLGFFGTNAFARGDTLEKTLVVWRDGYGRLCADER
jgi:hypothetical protein